jgi:hypothetical protein
MDTFVLNIKCTCIRLFIFAGSQIHGCYFAKELNSDEIETIQQGTDPIMACSEYCAKDGKNMSSIFLSECRCQNTSLSQYITLPETHCNHMCYDKEPLENVGRCGGIPAEGVTFANKRSFYIRGLFPLIILNFIFGVAWFTRLQLRATVLEDSIDSLPETLQ